MSFAYATTWLYVFGCLACNACIIRRDIEFRESSMSGRQTFIRNEIISYHYYQQLMHKITIINLFYTSFIQIYRNKEIISYISNNHPSKYSFFLVHHKLLISDKFDNLFCNLLLS